MLTKSSARHKSSSARVAPVSSDNEPRTRGHRPPGVSSVSFERIERCRALQTDCLAFPVTLSVPVAERDRHSLTLIDTHSTIRPVYLPNLHCTSQTCLPATLFITRSMAEPSKDVLAQHVRAMLKGENLDLWTARKVREKLQMKFNLNLKPRKQDIISICQQVVNESDSESDSGGDSDSEKELKNANGKRVKKQSSSSRGKDKSKPSRKSTAKKIKVKKEPVSPKKKANDYSCSSDEAGGDAKSTSSYSDRNDETDEEENNNSFNNSFSNNESENNSQSVSSQQKLTSTTISINSSNIAPGLSGTSSAGNSDSDKTNGGSDSDSDRSRVDDAEIARRLQEEEYKRGRRATRSGGSQNGTKSKRSKGKSSKKSSKNGHSNDDSDDGTSGGGKSGKKGWAPIPLSPEMAEFTGQNEMTRSQVVKYIYAYCKENDLQDPNNRQFAICDDALYKLIGVKRFRMFGMIKLLTRHFLRDS